MSAPARSCGACACEGCLGASLSGTRKARVIHNSDEACRDLRSGSLFGRFEPDVAAPETGIAAGKTPDRPVLVFPLVYHDLEEKSAACARVRERPQSESGLRVRRAPAMPRNASMRRARIATASAMRPMIVNAKPIATASAMTNVTSNDRARGIDRRIRLERQRPSLSNSRWQWSKVRAHACPFGGVESVVSVTLDDPGATPAPRAEPSRQPV